MKTVLYIYLLLIVSFSVYSILPNDEPIDLITAEDKVKLPSKNDENYFYIPIFHTNDIHGSFYPKKILLPSLKGINLVNIIIGIKTKQCIIKAKIPL